MGLCKNIRAGSPPLKDLEVVFMTLVHSISPNNTCAHFLSALILFAAMSDLHIQLHQTEASHCPKNGASSVVFARFLQTQRPEFKLNPCAVKWRFLKVTYVYILRLKL